MKRSVLRALLSGAYGLAWLAARPVLCRHKRLQEGFPQRLVPDGWPGSALGMETGDGSASSHTRSDIWLQAASGGEAYLVWELLAHLAVLCEKQGTPEPLRVLATTWTRQGLDILQDMSGDSLHSIPSGDAFHTSIMTEDSRLFKYFPVEMHVNSAHHQRIDRLGQHLKIIQRCPDDGCPEALEHDELPILGLQWHPERLPEQAGEPLLYLLSSYF